MSEDRVWVRGSFYTDLIRRANQRRTTQPPSTLEVQDGNGNTLTYVVQCTGDADMDNFINAITKSASQLGGGILNTYGAGNIIDDGFENLPASMAVAAFNGNRRVATYQIFRTGRNPPPPSGGNCGKTVAQTGAIVAATGTILGFAAVASGGFAAVPAAVAAGAALSLTGNTANIVNVFSC